MAKSKNQKNSGQTASKKTGVKKAKKALARAEESVDAARKAVKASRKKLRRMVAALSHQTERLSAKQAKAVKKSLPAKKESPRESAVDSRKEDSQTRRDTASTTVSEPVRADQRQNKTPEPTLVVTTAAPPRSPQPATSAGQNVTLTPPLPSPKPASPTLVELRQQARERKIPGYSRLNKAELTRALDAAQRS